jgi:hypothetical protein
MHECIIDAALAAPGKIRALIAIETLGRTERGELTRF